MVKFQFTEGDRVTRKSGKYSYIKGTVLGYYYDHADRNESGDAKIKVRVRWDQPARTYSNFNFKSTTMHAENSLKLS